MKIWADYLFTNLNDEEAAIGMVPTVSMEEVAVHMKKANKADLILDENQDGHLRGEIFRNCHYQALRPISRIAALAGFLSLWLKRCVLQSPPRDDISIMVIFPTVDLTLGRALGLLPAMVCGIQHGCVP